MIITKLYIWYIEHLHYIYVNIAGWLRVVCALCCVWIYIYIYLPCHAMSYGTAADTVAHLVSINVEKLVLYMMWRCQWQAVSICIHAITSVWVERTSSVSYERPKLIWKRLWVSVFACFIDGYRGRATYRLRPIWMRFEKTQRRKNEILSIMERNKNGSSLHPPLWVGIIWVSRAHDSIFVEGVAHKFVYLIETRCGASGKTSEIISFIRRWNLCKHHLVLVCARLRCIHRLY